MTAVFANNFEAQVRSIKNSHIALSSQQLQRKTNQSFSNDTSAAINGKFGSYNLTRSTVRKEDGDLVDEDEYNPKPKKKLQAIEVFVYAACIVLVVLSFLLVRLIHRTENDRQRLRRRLSLNPVASLSRVPDAPPTYDEAMRMGTGRSGVNRAVNTNHQITSSNPPPSYEALFQQSHLPPFSPNPFRGREEERTEERAMGTSGVRMREERRGAQNNSMNDNMQQAALRFGVRSREQVFDRSQNIDFHMSDIQSVQNSRSTTVLESAL